MKKQLTYFIRLVNFEFERMYKYLVGIMAVVVVSNLIGFIVVPMSYMRDTNTTIQMENLTIEQFLYEYSSFSLYDVFLSNWVAGPIALGIIGLLIYSMFTWYREWFGKNTFIYRLLMLPVSRIQVYFSKLLVVLIGIFSLVSLQFILLLIGNLIVPKLVPSDFFYDVSINSLIDNSLLSFMIHNNIYEFVAVYGSGVVFLLILFTFILFERSYHIKGFVMGLGYGCIALAFILSPYIIRFVAKNDTLLFPSEMVILISIMVAVVGIISIYTSHYLLKNKITL